MAKDPIKKAKNGTYYFRANLGYDSKGKKIQKYRLFLLRQLLVNFFSHGYKVSL